MNDSPVSVVGQENQVVRRGVEEVPEKVLRMPENGDRDVAVAMGTCVEHQRWGGEVHLGSDQVQKDPPPDAGSATPNWLRLT